MVLGLRSKTKRFTSVQVEFIIDVLEIKPWPTSQSLKSISSVVLQWENGDRNFGLTNPATPSFAEGKIEINESFMLQITLMKESSGRNNESGSFHKNILQLYLHEPRKDKTVKGQQLGTAVLDLAQHALIKDSLRVGVAMNLKRSFRSSSQPVLYLKLQSFEKNSPESSSRDGLAKEMPLDRDGKESVSTLMSEEYAEEDEIASFTDDDVSSHSSVTNSSSVENNADLQLQSSPEEKFQIEASSKTTLHVDSDEARGGCRFMVKPILAETRHETAEQEANLYEAPLKENDSSPQSSLAGLAIDYESSDNRDFGFPKSHGVRSEAPSATCSLSSHHEAEEVDSSIRSALNKNMKSHEQEVQTGSTGLLTEELTCKEPLEDELVGHEKKTNSSASNSLLGKLSHEPSLDDAVKSTSSARNQECSYILDEGLGNHIKTKESCIEENEMENGFENIEEVESHENTNTNQCVEDASSRGARHLPNKGVKEAIKNVSRFNGRHLNGKVHELERRIEVLEGELKEAAALEMGLYGVVAEHESSMKKVHTPARRLSRLYLHASELLSAERRAGAARSIISGLVMVAKACGNDVPRLTFWLSNSVVLRAIVSHASEMPKNPKSYVDFITNKGTETMRKAKKFQFKWESNYQEKISLNKDDDDWEDLQTFVAALEKIEAWIFSRIVESVWCQSFTPYMHSSQVVDELKSCFKWKKKFERGTSLDEKKQKNYSFDIWKEVFQDAREKICPVRGEGIECGCLLVLAKLVMEQCVARLDVAFFNALLRESEDETSIDPMADPIINHEILPIPPGKSSFGAGAQLKNAIGNWSRSLTDLFAMDVDERSPGKNDECDEKIDATASPKFFHLLSSLSDLFMLPKDMLLMKKVRKEVCPKLSSTVIKSILSSFFPDEYCPDQVPASLLEALSSEDQMVNNEGHMIRNLPCSVFPISYSSPSVASIQYVIENAQCMPHLKRSRSSLLQKCHASDEELEELHSPLSAIIPDKSSSVTEDDNSIRNPSRYHLLRDVWKFDHS